MRHRADERELNARVALLDRAVGVDHPERVLPGIESRDLGEQRPRDVDAELVDDVLRILNRERHVLRRQRVDRRWPDERLGQAFGVRHVFAQVEDGRVVAADRRQEDVEDLLVRRREVDVSAPDPLGPPRGEVVDHRDGLRVVHDHEVVLVGRQLFGVHDVVAAEDLDLVGGQRAGVALQAVVERLRDVEELLGALDDAPLDLEADVGHQGHERVVDLGDTAAERGRREMDHALGLQRLGEPMNLADETARGDRRVVGEALVPDVDELEQSRGSLPLRAALSWTAASRTAAANRRRSGDRSRARRRAPG